VLADFFYREMPLLIGRAFVSAAPLYRLSHGGTIVYARDDAVRRS